LKFCGLEGIERRILLGTARRNTLVMVFDPNIEEAIFYREYVGIYGDLQQSEKVKSSKVCAVLSGILSFYLERLCATADGSSL